MSVVEDDELLKHKNKLKPIEQSILEIRDEEVRRHFLKSESYCNFDLPKYIVFDELLNSINDIFAQNPKNNPIKNSKVRKFNNVNYTILNNKDGKYAWRPLELIHPVLYVSLVREITENSIWDIICCRFKEFQANEKIHCLSIPRISIPNQKDKATQISYWWRKVEQRSIELSLEYEYLLETDITDCYGSIYTHSIAWALHGKEDAKKINKTRS